MVTTAKQQNWAGNYQYQAKTYTEPQSVDDLQRVIASRSHTSGLGSRHSFNAIADTSDTLISLRKFNRVLDLDENGMTVTVEGGITYGELAHYLSERGYALHNLASLPHISVVGACMTGTHGSGETNGNLATAVCGLEFITADRQHVHLTRGENSDEISGLVVGLGAYGIVTAITLHILPIYQVRQTVYLDFPYTQAISHFDEIQASAYSVSLFTDWQGDQFDQVWVKQRVDDTTLTLTSEFFDASAAKTPVHPLPDLDPTPCTQQLGIPGDWQDRLPHFRMDHTPSNGDELQSEYFVPREYVGEAIRAIQGLGEALAPVLYVSEVRTIAADDLWLSPCYERDSVAFHFTWKPQQREVMGVLPQLEQVLSPFGARPHWGKLFTMPPADIQAQYDRMDDFRTLVRRYDPTGKFTNAFLQEIIFNDD